MDALELSRLQFALTIAFHYIFPPLSIGMSLVLVFMEAQYLRTRDELYSKLTRFWVKIFGLVFSLGVASGIVMEFQFGTNWSTYSRYVGDVFGSALAAEGIFAFFLESGFLAILLFGWNRVKPRTHFISTLMVCLGSHFSAVWIVVANSWQQTPAGFHIVTAGSGERAEIVNFWQMVFNPSSLDRISHVFMGAWQAGAFFILSVSAYYLLKQRHTEYARVSIRFALPLAVIASLLQLVSGHASAAGVSRHQPAKLAALEGFYPERAPAPLYLFGWVDEKEQRVRYGVKIPGLLSLLVHGDAEVPVQGLSSFAPEERPPVNIVFQTYHLMITIGMALIMTALLGLFYLWRGRLAAQRWLLWIFVFAVLGPQFANQAGWMTAEIGRQPYIVYNLLRTSDAFSPVVSATQIRISLVLFGIIYTLLFILFIYLLNSKIKTGPEPVESIAEGQRA